MHEQTIEQLGGEHCEKHYLPISFICSSPSCNYFRKMCKQCCSDDLNHQEYHLPIGKAFDETKKKIQQLLMGLKALKMKKRKQIQININNNPGLSDIQSKLDEIRKMINQKIDSFRYNLRKIYFQHIKVKLEQLQEVIQKSQQFLIRQKQQLKKSGNIRPFFINDFDHQLKYYKSYLQEILIKKIRNFKSGLDADKVLSMIVSFQQNLEEIFMISKQKVNVQKPHLFFGDQKLMKKYQISQNNSLIVSNCAPALGDSTQINIISSNYSYKWEQNPQSVYYHQNQCFYIIGQGKKQSKKIMKYEDGRTGIQKFTLVGNLEIQRSNFSVCLINSQIYIVGGFNQKEGCLVKCQKFTPFYNNQVYIVSSLNQRSAYHTVCNYLDRYILKFGGVDRLQNNFTLKEGQQSQIKNIYPQIYSIQRQQWEIIEFSLFRNESFDFGLNPVVYWLHSQKQKIIVLGGSSHYYGLNKSSLSRSKRQPKIKKFMIQAHFNKWQIEQMRIKQQKFSFNKKYYIFPNVITQSKDKKVHCLVKDTTKADSHIQIHNLNIQS